MPNKAGVAIIMHSTVQIENVCKDCLLNVKAIERTNQTQDTPATHLERALFLGESRYIYISLRWP